jgi:hypothetical protein
LQEQVRGGNVDFPNIFISVNTAVSKAKDKHHVYDLLEINGAAREDAELKKLSQEMMGS